MVPQSKFWGPGCASQPENSGAATGFNKGKAQVLDC